MEAQRKLLANHFSKLGAKVRLQKFQGRDPRNGAAVAMANFIVEWHPEAKERIVLCAHYDTLPFPLEDKRNPRGTFVGANDGASGVAVLMELGSAMADLRPQYGVDFVFFDGEEFLFNDKQPFFQGSEYFARDYVGNPPAYRYRYAVLLDMVGDADLQIYQEVNSVYWADSRPLVEEIWGTAKRLGVREFVPQRKHLVRDDHLALHDIAKIPACDVIDFDYPAWHTQADRADRCSALSLAKVGWVIREWVATAGRRERGNQ
jgi:Zn-dependent M28 family amino/carboxypeptidase